MPYQLQVLLKNTKDNFHFSLTQRTDAMAHQSDGMAIIKIKYTSLGHLSNISWDGNLEQKIVLHALN